MTYKLVSMFLKSMLIKIKFSILLCFKRLYLKFHKKMKVNRKNFVYMKFFYGL